MTEHVPPTEAAEPDAHAARITGNQGHSGAGVAVDLNAALLKPAVLSPQSAVSDSAGADETARW